MCGICGFAKIDRDISHINENFLKTMNDQMILRGPDGGSEWLEKDNLIGLGHRRLSIIDLSSNASQPMCNEDGSIVIAFNGEIFNHAEIRKELEKIGGHIWKTSHSDTEVVVHAYEEWGWACLEKFRGMFAIALWDGRQQKFWLIRDRIGVKPLYYTVEDGLLIFASEIKAILKVLKKKPQIDHFALYDYLSFLTTPCDQTLFAGIKKLRPSTIMCLDRDGRITLERYWDIWDNTRPEIYHASENEIKSEIVRELRTAVQLLKAGDVPLGVFLSGGIDSSTNAALFSEGEDTKVKTFSIGYDKDYGSYKNEVHYAKKMADFVGAEYHERLLSQTDLFDILPRMVWLQDEPLADPVCIPLYYLSKLARDNGVIVSQVGEGADELFGGYESWKIYLHLMKSNDLPLPTLLKKSGLFALDCIGKDNQNYYEFLRRGTNNLPIFWSGAEAFFEVEKKKMLSVALRREIGDYTSFEAIRPTYERFKEKAWEQSHLNWMGYADLNHRLPELLLMRVDKMSMGVSLECRVPFLDHKFVELAMSIPESIKVKNGVPKYILKEAVRGIIPDELIDRKKQGFGVPVYDWFAGRLGEEMRKETVYFAKETGVLAHDYVYKMFDNKKNGHRLWYLFNLALWWKEYLK